MSDWFSQAIADIGAAVEDAVDDVVAVVTDVVQDVADVVDAVGDGIAEVGDAIADVVTGQGDVGDVFDAFGDAADGVGDAIVAGAVEIGGDIVDIAEDVADVAMNALDDFVFDPVDFVTGGAIDVDYDNGQFTAGLDFGVASVGVSIGDKGFSAEAGFDIGIASGDVSFSDADGFSASGSIGIDYGPLPYAEGHIDVSPDGEISIGGHLQGSLPLPGGSIGGEIDGSLYRNADGSWGATSSLDVNFDGPLGSGADFSTDTSLSGDGRGNVSFDTDVDLTVSGPGGTGAHLGTDTSIDLGRDGLDFDTGLDVSATGPGGTGFHVGTDTSLDVGSGGVDFDNGLDVSVTGPGGTHAGFSTDTDVGANIDADGNLTVSVGGDVNVDVNGRDVNVSGTLSQTNFDLPVLSDVDVSITMPDALDAPTPDPTAEAMSALAGSGTLADVLSGDGGDDAASALFGSPMDVGDAIDAASALVDSGAFDTFTSDVVSTDIVEAEADSVWDDVGP